MANDQGLRDQLVNTMQFLHGRGWCDGTGGNFSAVLQRHPLRLLMAPSGVDKGSVHSDALIVVDGNGTVITGEGDASAETAIHLHLISALDAGAVLHTHSLTATVLSRIHSASGSIRLEGWEMLKGLKGIATHEATIELPIVANDQDMPRLVQTMQTCLQKHIPGLLVAGHGLYAWGESLSDARRHVEILEFLLSAQWMNQLCPNQPARGDHENTTPSF